VVSEDVGRDRGRRLLFDVQTGFAWVRSIERGEEGKVVLA
jgi:chemotaxis receptor (MCP) glutamine deamidase CheD